MFGPNFYNNSKSTINGRSIWTLINPCCGPTAPDCCVEFTRHLEFPQSIWKYQNASTFSNSRTLALGHFNDVIK
jgi:hypothetical protein